MEFTIHLKYKYIVSRIDFRPQKEFWFCPHEGGRGITNVSSRILILSSQGGEHFDFVLRLFISFLVSMLWTYN